MLRNIWDYLTDKRQLSMRDRHDDELHWKINVSPIGMWGAVITLLIVITTTLMLLMAHTSILEIFPNYRTKVAKMQDDLTAEIMNIRNIEQSVNDIREFNDAITTILNGSTPASQSTTLADATRYDKTTVPTNEADSLLRDKMESEDGEYSLASNTKRPKYEAPIFSHPMEGTLYRSFNDPLSNNDIVIIPVDSKTTVMAVDQGTVVGISDHNDGTVTVTLQHGGGYISVYGNLSELLVRRGQRVSSGSVIGSVGGSNDENITHSSELYFELWRDGAVLNPEQYISISK